MISLFTLHLSLFFPMLAQYKGRVYNPCCGSSGIFVQSEKFVEEHGGRIGEDMRWQFGAAPKGNSDFAWVLHFIHHLAPQGILEAL